MQRRSDRARQRSGLLVYTPARTPSWKRRRHFRETEMNHRVLAGAIGCALGALLWGVAMGSELHGAAVLDHPCGKTAVKQMGLVHAGKMEEANKLSTKEMQQQWQKMPAKDREMMSGMMQQMSATEQDFANDIKSAGVLAIDGRSATLTVKKTTKDKNGTSASTFTQRFRLDGSSCLVSR
jgi:hypothetical protein